MIRATILLALLICFAAPVSAIPRIDGKYATLGGAERVLLIAPVTREVGILELIGALAERARLTGVELKRLFAEEL